MTANDLIAAFETLADAPDGVKRLRELVLQLAVRGKLVVSAAGEWPTVALSDVVEDFQNGTSSRGGERGEPVVVLRLADIKQGRIAPSSFRKIDLSADSAAKYRVREGDVLAIRVNGSGDLVGRMILVEKSEEWCYCDHLIRIRLRANTLAPRFLSLFGNTPDARDHLSSVTVTTAGQKTVNQKGLGSLRVPLPPLAEQHRVVARVDELMGLLDRLEAARTARDDVRRAARDAALAALRDAEDTDAVEAAWGRIAGQMDALFAEPEDVGPLRQAVLGLAVRGRLVPQDAKDEQISVPLARTRRERARLIEQKALRRTEPIDAEYPVPLARVPAGWAWARPDELCALERYALAIGPFGSDLVKSDYRPTGVPLVFVREITSESFGGPATKYVEEAKADELHAHKVRAGDLLITKMGAPPGDTAIYPDGCAEAVITADCIKFRPHRALCLIGYLKYLYRAPVIRAAMLEITMGIAHQKMSLKRFRATAVPVPPLAEQHRIVAKVDALMAICDALEARLATVRDLHAQFAAAAVHHLDV